MCLSELHPLHELDPLPTRAYKVVLVYEDKIYPLYMNDFWFKHPDEVRTYYDSIGWNTIDTTKERRIYNNAEKFSYPAGFHCFLHKPDISKREFTTLVPDNYDNQVYMKVYEVEVDKIHTYGYEFYEYTAEVIVVEKFRFLESST